MTEADEEGVGLYLSEEIRCVCLYVRVRLSRLAKGFLEAYIQYRSALLPS